MKLLELSLSYLRTLLPIFQFQLRTIQITNKQRKTRNWKKLVIFALTAFRNSKLTFFCVLKTVQIRSARTLYSRELQRIGLQVLSPNETANYSNKLNLQTIDKFAKSAYVLSNRYNFKRNFMLYFTYLSEHTYSNAPRATIATDKQRYQLTFLF